MSLSVSSRTPMTLLLLAATAAAGCTRATERRAPVTADTAPLFDEKGGTPTAGTSPRALLHAGDLVEVLGASGTASWRGNLDGTEVTRSGDLVKIRRSAGEPPGWVFRSDLGSELEVPSAGWLCRRMSGGSACEDRLRRALVPDGGGTFAYEVGGGRCALGLVQGRTVQPLALDHVESARVLRLNDQRVALVDTRWVKSPKFKGGSLTVLRLEPRLARTLELVTDENDTTYNTLRTRTGTLSVTPEALRFRGEERMRNGRGDELWQRSIDQTIRLPPPPQSR